MMNLTFESLLVDKIAFEVCEAYRAPIEHDEPVCGACGHLADDHESAAASVTELRRRAPRHSAPVRRAS